MRDIINCLIALLLLLAVLIFLSVSLPIATTGTTLHKHMQPHLYGIRFVEEHFQPVVQVEKYEQTVANGLEIMPQRSLAIVGLAWNLAPLVPTMVARLQYISRHWHETVHWIIIARDSTDDTVALLQEYTPNNVILHLPEVNIVQTGRLNKMTALRNIYIQQLQQLPTFDYVLVMDLDLEGPISLHGLAHSLVHLDSGEYDVLTANGLFNYTGLPITFPIIGYTYYDSFAVDKEYSKFPARISKIFLRGQDIIAVKSAFGGAALYKGFLLQKYAYISTSNMCEHITLHEQISGDGYHIGINPSMIVLAGLQGVSSNNESGIDYHVPQLQLN